jgi:hypothetical protein
VRGRIAAFDSGSISQNRFAEQFGKLLRNFDQIDIRQARIHHTDDPTQYHLSQRKNRMMNIAS